jgi:hypothetical protein
MPAETMEQPPEYETSTDETPKEADD